jgi:hypothetical protein
MVWKVTGEVWDFQQNRFISLSSFESDTAVVGDCLVDFSDRHVDLVTYVTDGTREQAKHRAGNEFHDVVMGINLVGGESAYVKVPEPEEVSEDEADPAFTVTSDADEPETVFNLFLVEPEAEKAATALSFDDLTEWIDLYREAGERNRRRLKEIVMGVRLFPFDRAMANFYAYKVVEDVINKEFSELRERSNRSKGKANWMVGQLRSTFEDVDSPEVDEAIETIDDHNDALENYSKADLWQEVAEQTGFYDTVWEKKESVKSLRLTTSTPANAITINAYYGDKEAQEMLRQSDNVDYEAAMERMEEFEQEVEERTVEQLEEEIETWRETFSTAPNQRPSGIAHGLRADHPDATAERETEFTGMVAFARHLVKQSITGEL